MAAWHYHRLSTIRPVWSPPPGNLLCDGTSGAEVINHHPQPRAAAWHLPSRTAQRATRCIRLIHQQDWQGHCGSFNHRLLQGKVPIAPPLAGPCIQNSLRPEQHNPQALWQPDFCQGTHIAASQLSVGMPVIPSDNVDAPDGRSRDLSIALHLPSPQCLVQNNFSIDVWWVNKRINKWVSVTKVMVILPKKTRSWGLICLAYTFLKFYLSQVEPLNQLMMGKEVLSRSTDSCQVEWGVSVLFITW